MGTIIRWTDETWNPATGCTKVSQGCKNCYAQALAERFRGQRNFPNGFDLELHPSRLDKPLHWRKPRKVFVNSMSDLFHERIPHEFRARVFDVMERCPQHTFQILTKRPHIAAEWAGPWPSNVWMGTSVEDGRVAHRIDILRTIPATVRFLSCEPLIGPIPDINLDGIHWVIVGGESGPKHRKMDHDWARSIRDACLVQNVAFFFKQDSGPRTEMRPILDGERWEQYPSV